ncbi:MAG: hypothetical protein QXJ75_05920 [Candidatus Bathyarchaeia archaeon]
MRRRWTATFIYLLVLHVVMVGLHFYGTESVAQTGDQATREVEISSVAFLGRLENPPRELYRITLGAENPSFCTVELSLTDMQIWCDEFYLGPIDDQEKVLYPGERIQFEGDFTLSGDALSKLRSRGEVTLQVKGVALASTTFLWVEGRNGRDLDESVKINLS